MVGKPVADYCLEGYNGTVFAYGQTGSGKTFTMQGLLTDSGELIYEHRGLIPRVLEYVFSQIRDRQKTRSCEFVVKCSYLEIYQESVTDLLNPSSGSLTIRDDVKRGVYVEGLTEYDVTDQHTAYNYMQLGASRRHVGETAMNERSSRSHSVFTLYIQSKEVKEGGVTAVKYSRLHLIDLAGSERQKNTEASGKRLKEAANINKSLLTLGNVIRALVEIANGTEHVHVQYRDSRLTFLLKDSLGGNSKTTIVATVSPADKNYGETLSTLKFANRAKMIKNNAVINEDSMGSVGSLQNENRKLKEQLQKAMDQLQRSGSNPDLHAPAEPNPDPNSSVSEPLAWVTSTTSMHIRQLETQWKKAWLRAKGFREEKEKMAAKVEDLQNLCLKKDYFIQSMKMIIKLRDRKIAMLQDGDIVDESAEFAAARSEAKLLQWQVDNHPEVFRFAIENVELRDLLDSYEHLYGRENAEYEQMQKLVEEMAEQIQRVVEEKHKLLDIINPAKSHLGGLRGVGSPVRAQFEVQRWRQEQQIDQLQSEIENLKVQNMHLMRSHREKEIELQANLETTQEQLDELEQQLKQLGSARRLEIEQIYENQRTQIEELRQSYETALMEKELTSKESEVSQKNATLSIITLEKQLSQLASDREKYLSELAKKDDEIKLLRQHLRQRDADQRRMSMAITGNAESTGFSEDLIAERDKMIRQNLEEQMKRDYEKRLNAAVSSAVDHVKNQYEEKLISANQEVLELKDQLEHAEAIIEETHLKDERLADFEQRVLGNEHTISKLEQINMDTLTKLEIMQSALRGEHDQKVRQLAQQNEALQHELGRMKESLDARDWDLVQQHQAATRARERIDSLEAEMSAKSRTVQSLSEMVENLRSTNVDAERRILELEMKLSDFSSQLRDRDEEVATLRGQQNQLNDVKQEKEHLVDQIGDLVNEAKMRQDDLRAAHSKITALETARDDEAQMLRKELDSERLRFDDLSSRLHEVTESQESQRQEFESLLSVKDSEIARLHNDLRFSRDELVDLREQHQTLAESYKVLHSELTSNSGLSAEVVALNDAIRQLQRQKMELESQLSQLRGKNSNDVQQRDLRIDQLQLELGATVSKVHRLSEDLQASHKTVERLQHDRRETEQKFQLFEEEREHLFAQLAEALAEKDSLAPKVASFDRMRSDLAESLKTQQQYLSELRAAKAAEEASRRDCEFALRQLKALESERDQAIKSSGAQKTLIDSLNQQLDKLISHNNPNQKIQHHVKIKEENNSLRQDVHRLSTTLREKQDMVNRLQQKVEELNLKLSGKKEIPIDFDEEARLKKFIADQEQEMKHLAMLHSDSSQRLRELCGTIAHICESWKCGESLSFIGLASDPSDAVRMLEMVSSSLHEKDSLIRSLQFSIEMQEKERAVAAKVNLLVGADLDEKENTVLQPAN
jgi:kinesin family member 15